MYLLSLVLTTMISFFNNREVNTEAAGENIAPLTDNSTKICKILFKSVKIVYQTWLLDKILIKFAGICKMSLE